MQVSSIVIVQRREKMKIVHIPNLASAIPRCSKLSILIFNHAFFILASKTMGIEITIVSRRFEYNEGYKMTWFKWNNWKNKAYNNR